MKKNILITGASGNLGRAAVEKFIKEGYRVIAIVSPGTSLGFDSGKNVVTYEADLTIEKSVDEMIGKVIADHQTIDAAILTVGGYVGGTVETTDGAIIQKMISLNFYTAYFVARPVFQQMMKQGTGRIVLVGSRPALEAAEGKKSFAYALSKSLVFKLAELLNAEALGKDIVTSVIVPSTIDTPANRQAMPNANFSNWVTVDDITEAIYFLAMEKGRALRAPVWKLYANA
jgi:NAD(P)-dependent dehydrogenase (short-subunit alcohol dehydrogenase family)